MRVLLSQVHGGYNDSFLAGDHEYLFPSANLRDDPPDVVVLQRLEDVAPFEQVTGRRLGRELPTIYLEHNTPRVDVPNSRHPFADRPDVLIVHVTHFNHLFWDCGSSPTMVIEHGVVDPGLRYTGERAACAFVVNEPVRRWRATGTDLLNRFAPMPVDAFGIDADLLPERLGTNGGGPWVEFGGNLGQEELYDAIARRRLYLHLNRWTSLGLSLLQAMMLGLPVVVLATTEASRAVPAAAGAVSLDIEVLRATAELLLRDSDEAARRGRIARATALDRYPIERFLSGWNRAFDHAQDLV